MEIQKFKVNGKKVFVIDNILNHNKIRRIYTTAKNMPFTFTQRSDRENLEINNTRWAYHLDLEDSIEYQRFAFLFEAYNKIVEKKKILKRMKISEIYINIADAMTVTLPHTDRPAGCWTLLYYANHEWDIKWGGQTNFINEFTGEIELACIPKPGRFALFEADILHQATPPVYYSPYKRVTIPFKLDPTVNPEEILESIQKENNGNSNPIVGNTNSCW
jgi:hypothetical protein